MWRLDLTTNHWYAMDDLPLDTEDSFFEGTLCYCGDKYWAIGSLGITTIAEPMLSDMAFVYSGGEWAPCVFSKQTPRADLIRGGLWSEQTIWLVLGGPPPSKTPVTYDTLLIEGVELLSEICDWEPATGGAQIVTSRLYASNDHLPITTANLRGDLRF